MYEDMETDNGVAYNTENFDDDFSSFAGRDISVECEEIWEECPYGNKSHLYCYRWKECREDYETL